MNKKQIRSTIFLTVAMMLITATALTSATYAWFSANHRVSTSRVQTRTGEMELSLLVDSKGGSAFKGSDSAELLQVNKADSEELQPVSTADLEHFVYNAKTEGGMADAFIPVQDEAYYFHGRIYLKAEGKGFGEDAALALYLEKSEKTGQIVSAEGDSLLLNAARLGLRFAGEPAKILRLSETHNPDTDRTMNTMVNGEVLTDGMVLRSDAAGAVTPIGDPSEPIEKYVIDTDGSIVAAEQSPLLIMELNKVYTLDVYFYLEGCDPDCTDGIHFDAAELGLSFFWQLLDR